MIRLDGPKPKEIKYSYIGFSSPAVTNCTLTVESHHVMFNPYFYM